MNTKDALKQLSDLFDNYDFIFRNKFLEELHALLFSELKGKESKFFKCLTNQLKYVHDFGVLVHKTDGHEQIKGFDGHYYSIHIERKEFNIRFLVHISDTGTSHFLCAFYERAGKRHTDYTSYTDVMEQRFREFQKGDADNE